MTNLSNDDRLRNFSRFVYVHPIYKEAMEKVKDSIWGAADWADPNID